MTREDQKSLADLVAEKRVPACPECGAPQWTGMKEPNHFSTCSRPAMAEHRPIHVHDDGTADDDPNCPAWPAMTENRVPTLTRMMVQNALDEAWLESHDARALPRPPDLAEYLYEALTDYAAIERAEQPAPPLDVERFENDLWEALLPFLRVKDRSAAHRSMAPILARLGSEAP